MSASSCAIEFEIQLFGKVPSKPSESLLLDEYCDHTEEHFMMMSSSGGSIPINYSLFEEERTPLHPLSLSGCFNSTIVNNSSSSSTRNNNDHHINSNNSIRYFEDSQLLRTFENKAYYPDLQ
eukprot:CAMPEP_0202467380 /NCGR_PEP_ID=MMETSP1360-20130828/71768_1 /ASSEMBLY_ACC=CAM_ASM_000848 /TAXON_ID=515479 /ORGANISM="Licmophora paradoxa, Strain CCMP2313" /LENGTH=121 /DNA_ID=CAMNT_0049091897 /DNA_START=194 /DNA_END=559 /DNA_ORIENTATION=+